MMTPSEWVGLIGGLTGFVGGVTSLRQAWYDRPRLQMHVVPETHFKREPPYFLEESTAYAAVVITNAGTRPIMLLGKSAGLIVDNRSAPFIMQDAFPPTRLEEAETSVFPLERSLLEGKKMLAGYVQDSTHRRHYFVLAKGISGVFVRVKILLRQRPFSLLG